MYGINWKSAKPSILTLRCFLHHRSQIRLVAHLVVRLVAHLVVRLVVHLVVRLVVHLVVRLVAHLVVHLVEICQSDCFYSGPERKVEYILSEDLRESVMQQCTKITDQRKYSPIQ
jgi:hypothetical protein